MLHIIVFKEPPRVLQGTVTCLLFEDNVIHTRIAMCLKDVATMEKVKAAYHNLCSDALVNELRKATQA
jgi:hypothetical protein